MTLLRLSDDALTKKADKVAGALWGMLIADALAMPAHWFYGGGAQIRSVFGKQIDGYLKPPESLRGSIMALSNTGGAGRGSSDGDIVGTVINHGKKKYWKGSYHYHCTLPAGGTTLEGEMARLTMRSLSNGPFEKQRLQQEYIRFMTTPDSHSDAYASSYHRLFFARRSQGIPDAECPSNDGHNVDAIDGLIMPCVVLLGRAMDPEPEAAEAGAASVSVTRRSTAVEKHTNQLSLLLRSILDGTSMAEAAQTTAVRTWGRKMNTATPDPVVACYIDSNWESLVLMAAKGRGFEDTLLANANAGGENVHRGIVLGCLVGAEVGASGIPSHLKRGLAHHDQIAQEIERFVVKNVFEKNDLRAGEVPSHSREL